MTQFPSQFSRRRFLFTAGASTAATILLKGCMGNPPDTTTGGQSSPAASPVTLAAGTEPEVTTAKLGYIPIVESAPLIIAKEKGFFAKYGMPDVQVEKQANWGARGITSRLVPREAVSMADSGRCRCLI